MPRVYFGLRLNNWNIGLTFIKTDYGLVMNASILPLTLIIRFGGPDE